MRTLIATVGLSLLSVLACGGDDAADIDSAPPDAPSSAMTGCGDLSCDRATSVCVSCECGGPTSFTCEPIPEGCESDRTCDCLAATLCAPTEANPIAMCSEQADNAIDCDRGLD